MSGPIPFFTPDLGQAEISEVTEALRSGWLSNGPRTARFEHDFAAMVGARAALGTASGTAALYLALLAAGIGPGDEVITTAVTCIATVNAIVVAGATPVLVDVRADTLTLDPAAVEAAVTGRTVAILPVHYAGHPSDVDELTALARRHGLLVIDDAAHALGAKHRGRPIGSTAALSVFSFSATKLITTGEGGMLVGRPDLVARARILACLGADRTRPPAGNAPISWSDVVAPGLKLAMCDVAASLGSAQLGRLPGFLARRREIADRYTRAVGQLPGIETPVVLPEVQPAWHLYTLRIRPGEVGLDRDAFIAAVREAGGMAAHQFKPAHHEPYLRERLPGLAGRLPVTERESARNLSLPLYPAMTDNQVDRVITAIERVVADRPHHPL
jgi:dTDP-4-amino-4,6-dideoxygalactose transaminase